MFNKLMLLIIKIIFNKIAYACRSFKKTNLPLLFIIISWFTATNTYAQPSSAMPTTKNDTTEILITGQQNISKWFRAESQHFIVYSDTKHEAVSQLLINLERLDYILRVYLKIENKVDSSQKLTLYYQNKTSNFKIIGNDQPAYAIGLYNSCASGVQGFGTHLKNIATLNNDELNKPLNESLSYIFEAYTRHFLYRYTNIRNPTSFIDGFAQYFASIRFSETQMIIGKAPTSVGNYLSFLSAGHKYSLDYKDILEQNDSKGQNYAGNAGVRLEFEAKSWLLTHYMLSSSDNLVHLHHYLDFINDDMTPTQAFEKAFGFKVSKLSYILWKYRTKSAKAIQFELSALPVANINFKSLPIAADNLLLADAVLKSCPTAPSNESLLKKINTEAKKYPNSDFAKTVLSRAQITLGSPQDAVTYLSKITQEDHSNFDAFYLLGLAQSHIAIHSEGEQKQNYIEASKRNLLHAQILDPTSPEVAYALFQLAINTEKAPNEETLNFAISAWQNAHEVNEFAKAAALSYTYSQNIPEAEKILELLIHNIRSPEYSLWAKTWQTRLAAGVKRSAIITEMRSELKATPFQEWTIANETVMKAVELGSGLENAQGFFDDQMKNEGLSNLTSTQNGMKK